MTTPSIYDQYCLSIDGALATQTQNIKLQMDGKDVTIETILLEFAGVTPSPKTIIIDVEEAVPTTGFEFDPFESFLNTTLHDFEVQALGSGKRLSVQGFVQAPDTEAGVGKASKLTFKALCTPGLFK